MTAYEELKAWCEKHLPKENYEETNTSSGPSLWIGDTLFKFFADGSFCFLDQRQTPLKKTEGKALCFLICTLVHILFIIRRVASHRLAPSSIFYHLFQYMPIKNWLFQSPLIFPQTQTLVLYRAPEPARAADHREAPSSPQSSAFHYNARDFWLFDLVYFFL